MKKAPSGASCNPRPTGFLFYYLYVSITVPPPDSTKSNEISRACSRKTEP